MEKDNLKINHKCMDQNVIVSLFNELNLKHNKDDGEILLQYQDNTLFVLEQDYGDLKILEEITLKNL